MMFRWLLPCLMWGLVLMVPVSAASLFDGHTRAQPIDIQRTRGLIQASAPADGGTRTSSLFSGRQGKSLFAPSPVRLAIDPVAALTGALPRGTLRGVVGLRDLIAKAEAGPAGYNAVVWSAKIKTPKPPTQMTLREIYRWIKDTPGQNHAIGRYQFIPNTLRYLVKDLGLPIDTRFTPEVQDRLADILLEDAGLSGFLAGKVKQQTFMNNLAKIWAGLPASTGKSHYHGYGGNKAVITWTRFNSEMTRIFSG